MAKCTCPSERQSPSQLCASCYGEYLNAKAAEHAVNEAAQKNSAKLAPKTSSATPPPSTTTLEQHSRAIAYLIHLTADHEETLRQLLLDKQTLRQLLLERAQ